MESNKRQSQDVIDKVHKLYLEWIDNTYIDVNGNIKKISSTQSIAYKSVYCLQVKDYNRIIVFTYNKEDAYVVTMDAKYNILGTFQGSATITVDNVMGNVSYISICHNFVNHPEPEVIVYPKQSEKAYQFPLIGPTLLSIPEELIFKSGFSLNSNNEVYTISVSSARVYKDIDISLYDKVIINCRLLTNTDYRKVFLTDNEGNIVGDTLTTPYVVDNTSHSYKYLSFECSEVLTPSIYAIGTRRKLDDSVVRIKNDINDIAKQCGMSDTGFADVDISNYIVANSFIDSSGLTHAFDSFDSAMFIPTNLYMFFFISGSYGESSYIVEYDEYFNKIEAIQGRNVRIDNSDGNIHYVSFCGNRRYEPLSLKANVKLPISNVVTSIKKDLSSVIDEVYYEGETVLEEQELTWLDRKYIDENNNLMAIGDTSSYAYKAVQNFDVSGNKTIRYEVYIGGVAKVVTLGETFNIINVLTNNSQTIDNSDGAIHYISLSNNFLRKENPKLFLDKPLTIKDKVDTIKDRIDTLENVVDESISYFSDKCVAVLGDSIMMVMSQGGIIGGESTYVGTDDVTYALSELTNIGGLLYVTSTLVDGQVVDGTTIQADVKNSNQESLNVETWPLLKEALGVNTLINTGRGGATIKGNVVTTAYPAHGHSTFNTMPNHCLELKRRVDAGEQIPNLIMMWAGTNDTAGFISNGVWVEPTNFDEIMALDYETQLLANTDAAMNYKKTFYGGLRFCLEYLTRNFPNATLMFFSPIMSKVGQRTYDHQRAVGSYIKKMAERYSAVFVDACVEIGINDTNMSTYLYDDLHPNNAGKILYTNFTNNKLRNLFFSRV